MGDYSGVTFIPIYALNQEEEQAIRKKRARLNRAEAVLTYIGCLFWLAFYVVCFGILGFLGFFTGWLIKSNIAILGLFIIGYVVGVIAPCMVLAENFLEWLDLKFTCWWRAFCNRRIDDLKWEYKLKKAEAMNIEIDKAFD